MDDDDVPETGVLNNSATTTTSTPPITTNTTAYVPAPAPAYTHEMPPTQPPRPILAQQNNEHILKEAFPGIDATIIKAVLIASSGQIDPAFNALLGE